jgi:hypothetical protein
MAWVRKTLSACMNFNTRHNVDFSYNGVKGWGEGWKRSMWEYGRLVRHWFSCSTMEWRAKGVLSSNPDLLSVVIHDVWRVGADISSSSFLFFSTLYETQTSITKTLLFCRRRPILLYKMSDTFSKELHEIQAFENKTTRKTLELIDPSVI